jgi:hypothetical protein
MKEGKADTIVLCSDCFKDEGLKRDAFKIGFYQHSKCPNCESIKGRKLTLELVLDLAFVFFQKGTELKTNYGGASLIIFNEYHKGESSIEFSPWLINDVKLLEETANIGFFYYGPRLWMVGEIGPLKSMQQKKKRDDVIARIVSEYPTIELFPNDCFYRLRNAPQSPQDDYEYDSPPPESVKELGRFASLELPILYASQDLEVCIHECRVTVDDQIFIAKLTPLLKLKLLDLTENLEEDNVTEFESLDLSVKMLFFAGLHSYEICRKIAKKAYEEGFDGIIYPSYYSYKKKKEKNGYDNYGISPKLIKLKKKAYRSHIIPNIAIFGHPINERKINVECINRVILNTVSYETSFGPAFHKQIDNEKEDKI